MTELKKAISFETHKLCYNKTACIFFIVFLLVVLVFPTVNYFSIMPVNEHFVQDRAVMLLKYQNEISEYQEILSKYSSSLSEREKSIYEDNCKRLQFYIDTNTIESDYLNADLLTEKVKGSESSGFMFYFSTIAAFFVWAIAIVAAVYIFVFEYHTGQYKNLIASQVSRRKIFIGKFIVFLGITTIGFVVLFLYALVFGLTQSATQILIVFNGSYVAVSALLAYLSYSVAIYVLMLVLSSVTIFIGTLFKNAVIAALSAAVIYGLALLMSFAFTNAAYSNPAFQRLNSISYIPFLSLQLHVGSFDTRFIITLLIHLLCTFILLLISLYQFNKRDI